eukprot:CAMPEP_0204636104 /NCGR_PEP_ID=MMETSP0717-20131115/33229_1 /ASSEMBLY_ACC=CAM_ASM_000666 /TAXON_ID=230516 /ORGANISM="Chaetoceros curvisetus" /LENGTH=48 /DNA_ID= /DNA_START= /DNA_END= /DNA_ORIENTATION=
MALFQFESHPPSMAQEELSPIPPRRQLLPILTGLVLDLEVLNLLHHTA